MFGKRYLRLDAGTVLQALEDGEGEGSATDAE
jgi:hypothetical protein